MKRPSILSIALASLIGAGCVDTGLKSYQVRSVDGIVTPTLTKELLGILVVRTEPLEFEDDTFVYERHRSYTILDSEGELVDRVRNHVGDLDESPSEIRLPPGRYRLRISSSGTAPVELDVEIVAGARTVVDVGALARSS